jgi:quercetin dioxygenase-like cupin family protein
MRTLTSNPARAARAALTLLAALALGTGLPRIATAQGATREGTTREGGDHAEGHGRARVAFAHALPRLDGSRLETTLVEVSYGPGESSPPHAHPCAVVGYVVEGAIRSQSEGEAERVYRAGESFYERPGAVHRVSANASGVAPARLLAYFTCDRRAPLTTPAPGTSAAPGGR